MESVFYASNYIFKKFEIGLENLTLFTEKILSNPRNEKIVDFISLLGPLFLISTVYTVWTAPENVLIGYKIESSTWIREALIDTVIFFQTLLLRKEGRILQLIMFMYSFELFLIYFAVIFR